MQKDTAKKLDRAAKEHVTRTLAGESPSARALAHAVDLKSDTLRANIGALRERIKLAWLDEFEEAPEESLRRLAGLRAAAGLSLDLYVRRLLESPDEVDTPTLLSAMTKLSRLVGEMEGALAPGGRDEGSKVVNNVLMILDSEALPKESKARVLDAFLAEARKRDRAKLAEIEDKVLVGKKSE